MKKYGNIAAFLGFLTTIISLVNFMKDEYEDYNTNTIINKARDYHLSGNNDKNQARYLNEQAAFKGDISAMYRLGKMHAQGEGGAQSYHRAREYWEISANNGDSASLHNLGILYLNSYGVEGGLQEARYYFETAAKQGDVISQYILYEVYGQKTYPVRIIYLKEALENQQIDYRYYSAVMRGMGL